MVVKVRNGFHGDFDLWVIFFWIELVKISAESWASRKSFSVFYIAKHIFRTAIILLIVNKKFWTFPDKSALILKPYDVIWRYFESGIVLSALGMKFPAFFSSKRIFNDKNGQDEAWFVRTFSKPWQTVKIHKLLWCPSSW